MNYKFVVGDICVAYMDPTWTDVPTRLQFNGEECEVVELLHKHHMMVQGRPEFLERCYRVVFGNDQRMIAKEHELRRLGDDNWVKQKIANMLDFPLPIEMLR